MMYMVRNLRKMYTGYEEAAKGRKQSKHRSCGRKF
jgi:hypothetical protein